METYRIAVLGAGKVGGTLGKKWLAAGHEVTFGVRDPGSSRLQSLQSESGTQLNLMARSSSTRPITSVAAT
jgi:8-hydroxy-5-deazaflavin:NADPH oxidoreductase